MCTVIRYVFCLSLDFVQCTNLLLNDILFFIMFLFYTYAKMVDRRLMYEMLLESSLIKKKKENQLILLYNNNNNKRTI